MTLGLLKRLVPKANVNSVWRTLVNQPTPAADRFCPTCTQQMSQVNLGLVSNTLELDVCRTCQMLWFDAGELDEMGEDLKGTTQPHLRRHDAQTSEKDRPLPPEATKAIALMKVEAIARSSESAGPARDPNPLMWFAVIFGLPVEMGTHWVDRVPVFTWTVAGLITLTSLLGFINLESTIQTWGFITEAPMRKGGLTLLTSFLLHGGWFHLLGNLYFLIVFGDNIEVQQGPRRFLGLLLLSSLAGDLLHLIFLPGSPVPAIGASGGIAGVMLAYAMLFPRARLGVLIFVFPIRIPIWVYMSIWLAAQVGGSLMMSHESGIGYGAHLGGALVGLAAGYLWRKRG